MVRISKKIICFEKFNFIKNFLVSIFSRCCYGAIIAGKAIIRNIGLNEFLVLKKTSRSIKERPKTKSGQIQKEEQMNIAIIFLSYLAVEKNRLINIGFQATSHLNQLESTKK